MIHVRFVSADGRKTIEVDAPSGTNLLDLAQNHDQPLEGTCEGQMACSTCHIVVDAADFPKLPRASEDEEDMLDLAVGVGRTSRLACQIVLDQLLDSLTVHIPGESRNMQGR